MQSRLRNAENAVWSRLAGQIHLRGESFHGARKNDEESKHPLALLPLQFEKHGYLEGKGQNYIDRDVDLRSGIHAGASIEPFCEDAKAEGMGECADASLSCHDQLHYPSYDQSNTTEH